MEFTFIWVLRIIYLVGGVSDPADEGALINNTPLMLSKTDLVAEYSLKDMSKPIGVSEYRVTSNLPAELEKQLPSVEDIQKRIK